MTNKFLKTSKGLELSKLQNGTADLNLNSLLINGSAIGSVGGPELQTSLIKSAGGNVEITLSDSTPDHPTGEVGINEDVVLAKELYCEGGIGTSFIGGLTNQVEIRFDEINGMIEIDAPIVRMTKSLEMGGPVSFSSISTRLLNFTSSSGTVGWEFNVTQNVTITRLQISKDHISAHKTIYLTFFDVITNTAVATTAYTTDQEDADYYYIDLTTPYPLRVRDDLYRYALSAFLPTTETNNIQSALSTIPGPGVTDVYNRSNTGASWAFPTTKGALDSMPIIEFRSSPTYPIGTENLKAYDVNVQHAYVNNSVIMGKTKEGFTNDDELVSKSYVDNLISNLPTVSNLLPTVKRVRITKTPDRAPTAGNAVYEDEYIRLGWDQATASDLEIQRTTSSPAYLSVCYKAATIAEEDVFVANANETYTLNNFGFNGKEIMECRLAPFDDDTAPAYHICIQYTESSLGTDDKLDWIITRYNIST
jgi:hypothetical protein